MDAFLREVRFSEDSKFDEPKYGYSSIGPKHKAQKHDKPLGRSSRTDNKG